MSRLLLFGGSLFVAANALSVERFTGKTVSVEDGQTIVVTRGSERPRVRLVGISAPPVSHTLATAARENLETLVLGKVVTVTYVLRDDEGRLLARVEAGNNDINVAVVRAGYGWCNPDETDDPDLAAAEIEARQNRRGVWAPPPTDTPTRVPTNTPMAVLGSPEKVLALIRSMTDCSELQREFDTAMDNAEARASGDPLRTLSLRYATAANERMAEIGCYGRRD